MPTTEIQQSDDTEQQTCTPVDPNNPPADVIEEYIRMVEQATSRA